MCADAMRNTLRSGSTRSSSAASTPAPESPPRSPRLLEARDDLLGKNLHLVEELGHGVGGEVKAEEVGDARLLEGERLLDDLRHRADEVDVLMLEGTLLLERRFPQGGKV